MLVSGRRMKTRKDRSKHCEGASGEEEIRLDCGGQRSSPSVGELSKHL